VDDPTGLRRSLRGVGWLRLTAVAVVLAAGVWLEGVAAPPLQRWAFAAAAMGIAATSVVLIAAPLRGDLHRLAWLQSILDAVLVTAVVATSGGARSLFTFLYVLTVMEACVLLARPGGLVVAALSSTLYIGLVLARTIWPLLLFGEPTETTAIEVLTVFVNGAVFLVLAVVTASLAERYRGARDALGIHERTLSDLRAFRDLIFESVGTGLIAVGLDHRITAFNRAAETITGMPAARALGQPWEAVFGAQVDLDEIRGAARGLDRQSPRHELQLVRGDGRRIPLGLSFGLMRRGDGAEVGLIGVCQDLSRIKEMEEQVRRADRLAAVGRLSANIAHEIRNPLASMSGAIEALSRELPPDARRGRLVEIALHESQRLNQLITDLLDYARPAPLSLMEVDAAPLLEEVLVLLEHRPAAGDVKLVREYDGALPLRADPQQLRQAMWNLCLNAVQSMPEGGELRVGGRPAGGPRGRVELWVADTGHGIAEADLPHIFEPFYSTKRDGTGLGLALTFRIVQDHGGHLDVKSEVGAGTTVTVALPAPAVSA
jgi:two-component system sensor histidine kinase PilS (NtrC family)